MIAEFLIEDIKIVIIPIINLILVLLVIYLNRRHSENTLFWVFLSAIIPIGGFIIFMIFGYNHYSDKRFKLKAKDDIKIKKMVEDQVKHLKNAMKEDLKDPELVRFTEMIRMLLLTDDAIVTNNNKVTNYSDGNEKFDDLFKDIAKAKNFIHLEYYIIRNDDLGKKLVKVLAAKAREGVEIRLLKDGVGCKALPRKFFKELTDAGGEVVGYFERRLGIYLRLNNRNHRKIAVIDGKIAYVGGYNIGVEYLGKGPLGSWRDAALRIEGYGALVAQIRFVLDWSYETGKLREIDLKYFPEQKNYDGVTIQIVSSGPDSYDEKIKHGYVKMINSAKKSVYLQTPYFVPDTAIADALRIAVLSGVDVRIMIPCKPDHPFIYWAGYANVGWLLENGVRVFTYDDGFIHAKTIVVDGLVSSVGSANWDIRSFKLNFETNAFIYDRKTSEDMKKRFLNDVEKHCTELTLKGYKARSNIIKMKETFALLFKEVL